MDRKMLFEAARVGNVEVLKNLLQQNPSILDDIKLTSLTESLLHAATKSGQLNFVRELLKIDVDIAGEVDGEGFRALDIAVIMGKVAIVKEILSFNHELARLISKDDKSALHYAAAKGRVEIIGELLSACPDCLEWVTFHGETALHLAVKNYQFDAFAELVKWVERLSKESMINAQDDDGNTVLHLAVSTKQYKCVKVVVDENSIMRGKIDVNAQNAKGLTPLDISEIMIQDCYDAKVRQTLQQAGGVRCEDCTTIRIIESNSQPIQHQDQSKNSMTYLQLNKDRQWSSDERNAILVVAALIATITFQAIVSPPSGFFHEKTRVNSTVPINRSGIAAYYISDYLFLFANTSGFSLSGVILYYLSSGLPFRRQLCLALLAMNFTYGSALSFSVNAVVGQGKVEIAAYFVLLLALTLPHLAAKLFPSVVKNSRG